MLVKTEARSLPFSQAVDRGPCVKDLNDILLFLFRLRLHLQGALQTAGALAQPHAGEGGGLPYLWGDVRQQHQVL